jgi:hypothetical protein
MNYVYGLNNYGNIERNNEKLTTMFSGPRFSTRQLEEAENINANNLFHWANIYWETIMVLTLFYVNQWAYNNERENLSFYLLQAFIDKGLETSEGKSWLKE